MGKVRESIPSIKTMPSSQLQKMITRGIISFDTVTEKTDGMSHLMGWDDKGFFSMSSGSGAERMRKPIDFIDRAVRRAKERGVEPKLNGAYAFSEIHGLMERNAPLMEMLEKRQSVIRGEVFYLPMGQAVGDEIKFIGTCYNPNIMGKQGMWVIHSQLPENLDANISGLNDQFVFDTDVITNKIRHLDIGSLLGETITDDLREAISNEVDRHLDYQNISPKWGSGTEGYVVHTKFGMFKVTSHSFREHMKTRVRF